MFKREQGNKLQLSFNRKKSNSDLITISVFVIKKIPEQLFLKELIKQHDGELVTAKAGAGKESLGWLSHSWVTISVGRLTGFV